jgi:glucose/arabinose dehydrogenase
MFRRPLRSAVLVGTVAVSLAVSACSDDAATGEPPSSTVVADDGSAVDTVDTGAELDQPVAMVSAPDDDSFLVAQRGGAVVEVVEREDEFITVDDPVIDLTDDVGSTEAERGLLGLAVAPDGAHLYASYTRAEDGASRVDEFALDLVDGAWRADPETRRTLLAVDQPFANHNGGHVEFGPDGMLYLGLGDGGAGGDPEGRAQDPGTLLGKIVRLDPAADPPVPEDNPFVGADPLGARDEIWATGLRNPWRFSFDSATGDLWIGDVGQDTTEEVDVLRAADGTGRGANLGWDLYEGDEPFADADPAPGAASEGPFVSPVFTYDHGQGCSITGGVVYRGEQIPSLDGTYLYADLCGSGVRALRPTDADDGAGWTSSQLTDGPEQIVGFARDSAGEVFVISLTEGVFRLRSG